MRGRYQGGSLAGFIIIGVVLTLVFVGGLYGLNRYNAEQTAEVAKEEADNTPVPNSKNEEATEPKPESDKAPEKAPATTDSEATDSSKDEAMSEALPETGPADTIAAAFIVTVLGFATAHYLQSRSYRVG